MTDQQQPKTGPCGGCTSCAHISMRFDGIFPYHCTYPSPIPEMERLMRFGFPQRFMLTDDPREGADCPCFSPKPTEADHGE